MNTKSPSFLRVLWTDYTALISVLFPVVVWFFYLFFYFVEEMPIGFLYFSGVITVVSAAVLAWRWRTIVQIFDDGQEVPGRITKLNFYKDRGRITYSYVYLGQEYKSGNAVHLNEAVKALQVETPVVLLVDRSDPKRALIRDLYTQ